MKKILLIGGVNSFGVPYTRDNKENISFMNIIERKLSSLNNDVELFDMFSMSTYNTTEYLNDIINNNIDIYTIKNNQFNSIDLCRKSGIFQFLKLPKKTTKLYKFSKEDKNYSLTNKLRNSKNTIYIYSCGINDLMNSLNTGLGKLILPNVLKKKVPKSKFALDNVLAKIKSNLNLLKEINPNIKIYVLGLYIPTKYNYIRNKVADVIYEFNKELSNMINTIDNVIYVDNQNLTIKEMAPVDWHPNYLGQKKIAENILEVMKLK